MANNPEPVRFTTKKFRPGDWVEFQILSREHHLKFDLKCEPNSLTFEFENAVDAVLFRLALSDLIERAEA